MEKKVEYAVGSRIEMDGLIYEVQKSNPCSGCALYVDNHCVDFPDSRFGPCWDEYRSDKNDVIFVIIGEIG